MKTLPLNRRFPENAKALPSSLSLVTWNADHLVVVNFDRRDVKLSVLTKLLRSSPDVVCLQEIGSISIAFLEVIRRLQYDIHVSRTDNNVAGVAILVKRTFSRQFSLVVDVIVPGYLLAIRSTAQ